MENNAQGGQSAQAAGASQTTETSPQSSQADVSAPSSVSTLPEVSSIDPSVWQALRGESAAAPQQAAEVKPSEPVADDAAPQAAAPAADTITDEQLMRAFALANGTRVPQAAQPAHAPQQAEQPVQGQQQATVQTIDAKAAAVKQKIDRARTALQELDSDEPVAVAVTAVLEGLEQTLQDLATERENVRKSQEQAAIQAQQQQAAVYQEKQRLIFAGLEQQGIKGFGKNGVAQTAEEQEAQYQALAAAASIRNIFPTMSPDALIAKCASFIQSTKTPSTVRMAPTGQPRTAARTHSAAQAPKQISSDADAIAFIRSSPVFRPQMPLSQRA